MQYEPTREEKIQSFKDKKELENQIKVNFFLKISEHIRILKKLKMKTPEERFNY